MLTKSSGGCRARLEGRLSLPLLPPSTAGRARCGLQGLSSAGLHPRQRDFSSTRSYTKKIEAQTCYLSATRSFLLNQVLVKRCEHKLCCHDHIQGTCGVSHCCVTATRAHRTHFDQFIEVMITDNVPKHGRISLSTPLL